MDTPEVIVECDHRGCTGPVARLRVAVRARDGFEELRVRTHSLTVARTRRERAVRRQHVLADRPDFEQRDAGLVVADDLLIRPNGEKWVRLRCEGRPARPHQPQPVVVLERRLRAAYDTAAAAGQRCISLRELR